MAVPLHIIRLTMEIDKGNRQAYDQLKALARTNEDARRVLRTVKEPPKPAKPPVKTAPVNRPDTPEQTAEKAKAGDAASIAQLRKKAEYEDIRAQNALGLALLRTDPDEARKWLIRSAKMPESVEALRRMAASGDAEAKKWLDAQEMPAEPKRKPIAQEMPKRDELGYYKPPTKHSKPRIGDVFRLNDAILNTGQKNSMVLIKEMKGDFVTAWTVTREPGAGFASAQVYVLTDTDRVLRKDSLAEYRGSLGPRDIAQFRLSH